MGVAAFRGQCACRQNDEGGGALVPQRHAPGELPNDALCLTFVAEWPLVSSLGTTDLDCQLSAGSAGKRGAVASGSPLTLLDLEESATFRAGKRVARGSRLTLLNLESATSRAGKRGAVRQWIPIDGPRSEHSGQEPLASKGECGAASLVEVVPSVLSQSSDLILDLSSGGPKRSLHQSRTQRCKNLLHRLMETSCQAKVWPNSWSSLPGRGHSCRPT